MQFRAFLIATVAAVALFPASQALAGNNACPAQKTDVGNQTIQTTPAGMTGTTPTQSMAGVGSNNDMGMNSGVKQNSAGSVDLQGGYQGMGSNNAAFGVNAANNGKQGQATNQQAGFNGASVGGLGYNGGNGDLNLNNGGMAGVSKDGGSKSDGGSNYNWGGHAEGANSWYSGFGHPHDGTDSHGNTWSGGKLQDGTDQNGVTFHDGKPWSSKPDPDDKSGGHWDHGVYRDGLGKPIDPPKDTGGSDGKEPGADMGHSDGPGGSSATGATVNTGNRGGNDGGQAGNNGTSGGAYSNAMGATFNGGNKGGGDSPLGKPQTVEAMNTKVLNNGASDPCPGTGVSTIH